MHAYDVPPLVVDKAFSFTRSGKSFPHAGLPVPADVWKKKTDRMLAWFVTIGIALVAGALIFACEIIH